MLKIQDLTVEIQGNCIIQSLSLSMGTGVTHLMMGPNGSGKSSLAYTVAGHPLYHIKHGSIIYQNTDITTWSPERRTRAGIFLSLQNPPVIPGVKVFTLLKEAHAAVTGQTMSLAAFTRLLYDAMDIVKLDYSYAYRNFNEGFSGGERKRIEMLQILLLKPTLVIFDEVDSGLDSDGLRIIADVMQYLRTYNSATTALFITHYQRLIEYCSPDIVHVLQQGAIVYSGSCAIIDAIEQRGYDGFKQQTTE